MIRLFALDFCVIANEDTAIVHYHTCRIKPGPQITVGQQTMFSQNWVLTGQILGLSIIFSFVVFDNQEGHSQHSIMFLKEKKS